MNGRTTLQDMSREELLEYGRRGRVEDLEAARELLVRHRHRMGERSPMDAPNVLPFPGRKKSMRGGDAS